MNEPTVDLGFWQIVVGPGPEDITPRKAAEDIRRAFDYLIPTTLEEAFRPTKPIGNSLWFCQAIAARARCSWDEAADVCAEVIPEVWADMWMNAMAASKADQQNQNDNESENEMTNQTATVDYAPGHKEAGYTVLPIASLHPSNFNPRTIFTAESLEELASSIRNVGVLEPIVVRPEYDQDNRATGEYEIVAGERRYRASVLAELKSVPCIVRTLTDREAIEIAVTENFQRSDLTAFEEARGFQLLLDAGHKQAQIAERLGCSQTRISRIMGLLELPEETRKLIERGELSPSHGQRLLPWAKFPDVCNALADLTIKQEWKKAVLDEGLKNGAFHHQFGKLSQGKTPIIRHVGWNTKFAWKETCPNCPFKAFRPYSDNSGGYCLKPNHYDELQAEAEREHEIQQEELKRQATLAHQAKQEQRRNAELAQIEHTAKETGDPDALALRKIALEIEAQNPPTKLPFYRELNNAESLEYSLKNGSLPAACSEACECRGSAISKRYMSRGIEEEVIIPVCLNAARLSQLRVEERHQAALEARLVTNQMFAPLEAALVNESPLLHYQILVFIAGEYIRHLGDKTCLPEILKRHKVKMDLKAIEDYKTEMHIQAYNSLAKLGQAQLLHFLGDIIIAYETSRLTDRATKTRGGKEGELTLQSHVADFFLRTCPKPALTDDTQLALPGTISGIESEEVPA